MKSSFSSTLLLSTLALVTLVLPACGGEGMDDGAWEEASLEEISQAQARGPTTGGSCTIEQCSGIKDPFGTYKCDANGVCTCERGSVSGGCDKDGKNCKEKCSDTASTGVRDLSQQFDVGMAIDEVYVDDVDEPLTAPVFGSAVYKLDD